GSGWNAALMACLVGKSGHVYSAEVIPELVRTATACVRAAGFPNVTIVAGDGGGGYPARAPFDRAIFTAGAFDLPLSFHAQVREGGLLLLVVKTEGGGDSLYLLEKKADCFESLQSSPCAFVALRGRYHLDDLDPTRLDALPGYQELETREIARVPFWWGGGGIDSFVWRTEGIRKFLAIAEPTFRTFRAAEGEQGSERFFGLWDEERRSLVVATD